MEKRCTLHGREFNYYEGRKAGKPLLLLHGGSSRWQSFEGIVPALERSWHVFALDLRGHGGSVHLLDPDHYRIECYLPDIEEFIGHVIGGPAAVFGHSLGGILGLMLASRRPDLVTRLAIGDSPLSLEVLAHHSDSQHGMIEEWKRLAATRNPAEIAEALKRTAVPDPATGQVASAGTLMGEQHPWFDFMGISLAQHDPAMLTAINDHFAETYHAYRPAEHLASLRCPVLIMQGNPALGGLIRDEDAAAALQASGSVRLTRIEEAGHALHMQAPEAVLGVLTDFLKEE